MIKLHIFHLKFLQEIGRSLIFMPLSYFLLQRLIFLLHLSATEWI